MSEVLEHLQEVNEIPVYGQQDPGLRAYGRILKGYDTSELMKRMEETPLPGEGNIYVAGAEVLEDTKACEQFRNIVYGGMEIQCGYCNGRNTTLNAFEYHKSSEINIACTDMMLALGHSTDIHDGYYDSSLAQVFLIEKGTVLELFAGTLHFSPMRVNDTGFRDVIVLPKGTNSPLEKTEENAQDAESKIRMMKNKWIVCHPDRKLLVEKGAWPGMLGINREMKY